MDARKLGILVDRTRREFSDEDIAKIAEVYHAWRGEPSAGKYKNIPGFCQSVTLEDIRKHGHVLTPGRYVGAADIEEDDVPFEDRFSALKAMLEQQFAEADGFTATIRAMLNEVEANE